MEKKFLGLGAIACLATLVGTTLGCSGGGGSVCDVDFEALAGTYSFKMTTGRTDYTNSCFDNYENPNPDPATLTNCTWSETPDAHTITVELVVEEDGNIGSAKITNVLDSNGQSASIDFSVNCEMLEGEICNAPVRCTFSGDKCSASDTADPDAWKYSCNCYDGGMNDPTGQACLDCKAAFEKYEAESATYCQKESDSQYIEFTLTVK